MMMMMTTTTTTFAVWQTVLPYLFTSSNTCAPLKVKLSYYRLGQDISIPHSWGFPNFWTIRNWMWEGCQPYAPAAFTSQEISHVLISVRGLVNPRTTVQPEALSQWKIAMTPSGIKAANFQLVAHCLYQLHHCVPPCAPIPDRLWVLTVQPQQTETQACNMLLNTALNQHLYSAYCSIKLNNWKLN